MFSDVAIVVACGAGLFGAVSTLVIGNRYTRNVRILGWGGVVSGLALATLSYCVAGWCTHGFEPIQAWVLPPAGLLLLLVMAAQNWFVFYEDREDAAQSARPALVLLAAAAASLIVDRYGDDRTTELQVIWAAAISLAILLSIHPICRSIEVNRSSPLGLLVGVCKLLVPATGIMVFLLADILRRMRRPVQPADIDAPARRGAGAFAQAASADSVRPIERHGAWLNALLLGWEIGCLPLLTLINGARVAPRPEPAHSSDLLDQQKGGGSVAGQMPRAARDTVVWILVLAVHVLCGVVIARE
jgi:hypothetical protein